MNENPILVSDPSVMHFLVGLALPVGVGIVGAIVVWRTARILKRLSSNRIGKESRLGRGLEQISNAGCSNRY
mgnify:CR=1 FL=1